ncbi:MAG: hypothetical protein LBO63_08035 [Oscillospiraceae bacterium]|jgi:formate/nitrite transporter FocA (FNT family)|nr:hypothetical protein [Oscillospiraceae bacterium]
MSKQKTSKQKMSEQKKSLVIQAIVCGAVILLSLAMLIFTAEDTLFMVFDVVLIVAGAYGLFKCIKELKSGKYDK